MHLTKRELQTLKHGLYVRSRNGLRLRDRAVQRLVRRMRAAMSWVEDADVPAMRAWAEMELLAAKVYAELKKGGVVNERGEARRLLDDYRRLRGTQIVLSRELGLTPASRALIKATGRRADFDLAAAMAVDAEAAERAVEVVKEGKENENGES